MEKRDPPALDPARHALYLDFDGTLVDFAPEPDAISLRPGTVPLLERASRRFGGALALVSGRRIANLDRHVAPLRLPASGVHGQEIRSAPGAAIRVTPPAPEIATARARLAASLGSDDPLLLEDKENTLVLHFRKHPEQAARAKALARAATAGLPALHVVPGHAIYEIAPRGVTKAHALALLSAEPPFKGRIPVYVGDDTTDEDAIKAAQQGGGIGVKVGPGTTAARYRLADVGAVHAWLANSQGERAGTG